MIWDESSKISFRMTLHDILHNFDTITSEFDVVIKKCKTKLLCNMDKVRAYDYKIIRIKFFIIL